MGLIDADIIVNNRNGLDGDFSTPEHTIKADKRAWESCDTLNLGWGFQRTDTEWKSPKRVINDLTTCAQQGGNYLLNIGPEPNGAVTAETVRILETAGRWLATNGESIYGTQGGASIIFCNYTNFTRKGNTLYVHAYFWPSQTPAAQWLFFFQPTTVVAVGGVRAKVLSAKLLKTGQPIKFTQDEISLRLIGLPERSPDDLITVIACECDQLPPPHPPRVAPLQSRHQLLALLPFHHHPPPHLRTILRHNLHVFLHNLSIPSHHLALSRNFHMLQH